MVPSRLFLVKTLLFVVVVVCLAGPYFTAVDLAAIAQDLDDTERRMMAEGDVESEEYKNFLKVQNSIHCNICV